MDLIERLRAAERQGKEAAREGFSWARTNLEEAQSRMRRKMRIHPRRRNVFPLAANQANTGNEPGEADPIISINGKDVGLGDLPEQPDTSDKEEVA